MDKYEETADKDAYITTVEDMKRLYTAREVAAAQRAKEKIIKERGRDNPWRYG